MSVFEKMKSTLGAYSDTDVRGLLHADHVRILELAKDLAETDSAAHRKSVLRELKPFLTAHSRSEEAVVYAALMQLRNSADSREAGNEGMVEHNLADIVIERLAKTYDATSDMWKAHAKVLHEALEHHIKEEEGTAFEELGEHFTAEEREAMATQFVQGKERVAGLSTAPTSRSRKRSAETVE